MSVVGPGPRRLTSWTDSFEVYTEKLFAPLIFRKWAAISIIAGALERKVWTVTNRGALYPNHYVLLVGPPGVGKGLLMAEVNRMWDSLQTLFKAPINVTKSSLVDALSEAKRSIVFPNYVEFHSLQAAVPEFSDFAPIYDPPFMSILQSLYDCTESPYTERKRTKDLKLSITAPQFNLVAGTTPSYLNGFMPDGAWDQGFASRTIMAFSGEVIPVVLFDRVNDDAKILEDLKADLKSIHALYGAMIWEPDAKKAMQGWITAGMEPIPDHRRLMHYNSRRPAHMVKLCMIASAQRGNDLAIKVEDFSRALDWIIEVESLMPDIFKSMASGGNSAVIEDTWHYIWQIYAKEKRPILESRIIGFVQDRAPIHAVKQIVEMMQRSNMIVAKEYSGYGKSTYEPVPKHLHKGG